MAKIIILIISVIFLYIFIPSLAKIFLRKRFLGIINPNYAYLTFDDGPHPEATPAILDILEKEGAKATFFVLGENVEKYGYIMRRISENGHEIGEHSYSHTHPWKTTPLRSARDLLKGREKAQKYTEGERSDSFRPPYGKFNLITLLYTFLLKKNIAFWNFDLKDFDPNLNHLIPKAIKTSFFKGKIILLHDGRQNLVENYSATISAVEEILEASRRQGVEFATIGEGLLGPWHPMGERFTGHIIQKKMP
jgi:peptidoglycan/xylan/chitin deacetylase (PgdA/CDA1 family)